MGNAIILDRSNIGHCIVYSTINENIPNSLNAKLIFPMRYLYADMLVFDNQVAYKLNFDLKVSLSVIFDRNGNCLNLETSDPKLSEKDQDPVIEKSPTENNMNKMAFQIADMINDINKD